MKLVIDIPKGIYLLAKKIVKTSKKHNAITRAIANGTPIPKDATNGDVIKAVFPNATISRIKSETERTKIAVEWHFADIPSYYNLFYEDWWNTKYER